MTFGQSKTAKMSETVEITKTFKTAGVYTPFLLYF